MSDSNVSPIDGLHLYQVEVTHTIYVLAKDEAEAEMDAPMFLRDEMGDPEVTAIAIRRHSQVHGDVLESLPHWGNQDDPPTIGECITAIMAREDPAR